MSTPIERRLNPTPAQTWNRLNINDFDYELPEAPETPRAAAPAAEVAELSLGGGPYMTEWLDASAKERRHVEVGAGGMETVLVTLDAANGSDDIRATDVVVRAGARARVVIVASGDEGTEGIFGHQLRLLAEAGAEVELAEVVANRGEATYLSNAGLLVESGGRISVHQFVLTSRVCAMGLTCQTCGERSAYEQSTRYLVGRDETLDMNYLSQMRGPDGAADLIFSGVLSENAKKRLSDTIDLVHGCKGSKGHENEIVLVTGDDVVNKALPSVLCNEDDVEGTHGATIGAISAEQLDYAHNRGLSLAEAEALFERAVYDEALIHVPEAKSAVLAAARRALGEDAAEELEDLHG